MTPGDKYVQTLLIKNLVSDEDGHLVIADEKLSPDLQKLFEMISEHYSHIIDDT